MRVLSLILLMSAVSYTVHMPILCYLERNMLWTTSVHIFKRFIQLAHEPVMALRVNLWAQN
jgi:hypothetical protein